MRKIVIFAMILTFIFTLVGCTAHNEPDKKAVESSSTNAVIDTTQVEKLSEKAEGRKQIMKPLIKVPLRKKQHSRLPLKLVQNRYQKSRFFLKQQQQIPSRSKIFTHKKKCLKAKHLSPK